MADPVDPIASARGQGAVLPKRFYQQAIAGQSEGMFVVLLDGHPLRTPSRKLVALPSLGLAQAVAAEWAAQAGSIDPKTMPLTRIANSTIESVAGEMQAVADEIIRYAGSDLVCYRAASPAALVAAQARHWDGVLDWARDSFGARFVLSEGVMFVAQAATTVAAVKAGLSRCVGDGAQAPFRLAALSVMTTLTGSALIALRCTMGDCTADEAWAAAHVDEDFQADMWGSDEEASARREARWREMAAANLVLALA